MLLSSEEKNGQHQPVGQPFLHIETGDNIQRGEEHFDKQSLYDRSSTCEGGSTVQSSRSDSLDDCCSLLISFVRQWKRGRLTVIPPIICETASRAPRLGVNAPTRTIPRETAGLKRPPETRKKIQAFTAREKPKHSEM